MGRLGDHKGCPYSMAELQGAYTQMDAIFVLPNHIHRFNITNDLVEASLVGARKDKATTLCRLFMP